MIQVCPPSSKHRRVLWEHEITQLILMGVIGSACFGIDAG